MKKDIIEFRANNEAFTNAIDSEISEILDYAETQISQDSDNDYFETDAAIINLLKHELRWHRSELHTRLVTIQNAIETLDNNPTNDDILKIIRSLKIVFPNGICSSGSMSES